MRVLLVEDDIMIGQTVQSALKESSFATDWVRDGELALAATHTQHYDLILLDLGLPKKDGIDVLKSLRNRQIQTPIIIVTARDGVEERILGLDSGADDYVLKPFELNELLARMRAVIRRKSGVASAVLTNGKLTLDPSNFQVTNGDNQTIQLTNREFALLQALILKLGAILSRAELEERIYGWGEEVESNAIEFLIFSVRKKLGAETIKNIRGVGWLIPKEI